MLIDPIIRSHRHRNSFSSLSISHSPSLTLFFFFQGSSLIRGPSDVVQYILNLLGNGGQYPCTHSHSLAFSIGGQLFPVDPRDLASQALPDSVEVCYPNLAMTDHTNVGG